MSSKETKLQSFQYNILNQAADLYLDRLSSKGFIMGLTRGSDKEKITYSILISLGIAWIGLVPHFCYAGN